MGAVGSLSTLFSLSILRIRLSRAPTCIDTRVRFLELLGSKGSLIRVSRVGIKAPNLETIFYSW